MEYVVALDGMEPDPIPEKGYFGRAAKYKLFNRDTVGAEALSLNVHHYLPGGHTEGHQPHQDAEQVYYVISGTMGIEIEGKEYMAPAGSFVFIPRGATHQHRNAGADDLKFILINGFVRSGEVPPLPTR